MKIKNLRGIEIQEDFTVTTASTRCLACNKEIVFIKNRHRWEPVFVHETDWVKSFDSRNKTNLHDAECIGLTPWDEAHNRPWIYKDRGLL